MRAVYVERSDATPTLEAVRDCVVAITAADAPRGGRLVDFCRDRAQRSGAPQVAHALRRLTAAAEKATGKPWSEIRERELRWSTEWMRNRR